jgi:type IV pilus assembly protein PilQ
MNGHKNFLIGIAIIVCIAGFSTRIHGQEAAAAEPAVTTDATAAAETAVPVVAEPTPEGVFPSLSFKGDITEFLKLLGKVTQKNIIPSQQVRGLVEINMFDVTFKEALDAVLLANGYAYVEKGPFIFVYTQKEFLAMQEAARHMEVQVFQLSYIPTKDVSQLIAPLLSKSGMVTMSPEAGEAKDLSGEQWAGDNYIVVQDYPENLDQIEQLIQTMDNRPPQVLIEATILTASLDDTNQMGIDLFYAGGVNFEFVNSGADLAVTSDASTDTGMRTDFAGNVNTGGLSIGITSNNVGVLVRALESVTDVITLGNPKVLTLNRQQGKVIVGNRDGYITTEVSQTTATQTVEFLETGTQLSFRPFVMKDGYIRMELNPKDSDGGVEVTGEFTLPSESTAEITTNVLVRDGHTIVIGGLFRDKTSISRSQIPFAGNIPFLGPLFRSNSDVAEREEVIFLITPHIVKEEVDYAAGEKVLQECFVLLNAARDGLQWHSRDSLAAAHYNCAKKHQAAGDLDKALWNAKLATHMSPMYLDAYKLRNQLLGETIYRGEIGSMRTFMRNLIEESK